ncbi:MAG: Uma2 family endonuclease [Rhizobacter sp.]|nr:Uma2 family endonuclease [Chlorobiales bacterium]
MSMTARPPVLPDAADDHVIYPSNVKMPQGEKHHDICLNILLFLQVMYGDDETMHAGGDIFCYYIKGNPRKSFAPDAFVIRGIDKKPRKVFKLWEEPLDFRFALEVWSDSNTELEKRQKFALYQDTVRALEYAELDEDTGKLTGYRLNEDGLYEEITPESNGRMNFNELDAELCYEGDLLRLYRNGEKIPTLAEALYKK